ncbi:sigma-54-dependent transcriptional regulator [Oricola cellulosilytica]|uniref:Sigma-54-dependent Fis family transcriptional regulator n=1 Tax=Oricola cellulosilytica TaxID=1429082 RepID=A0A4R0P431_9HYPH|nr:sigma-54 dependent transcriptional regulator [Oricola cellulosilytica]TCD11376.1 sigma-54-dependent Fis family transcriptional regulator [Oricola cellulosilytica]
MSAEASSRPDIVLVDDDDDLRHALRQGLELEDLAVADFKSPGDALLKLSQDFAGAVISDIRMPGMDGMQFMAKVLEIDAAIPVILVTGHGDITLAVDAMREGAYDFIPKPFRVQDLGAVTRRALEKRRLVLENRVLRSELETGSSMAERIVGRSPAIKALREEITVVADTGADVIIFGETGAGKEVVARALHDFSPRAAGNFVALNCAALPPEIFESELFGHEAGAFTGAQKQRIGKLQHADGGTVFLDEIESMPLDLQAKLLRAIEDRTIVRLGSNRQIPLDVRFIAATKSDLDKESASGRFRADLFYRLNVVTLTIPPLRDRREDIPLLFVHLARQARARYRREMPNLTPSLEHQLLDHKWPGNVRELRNIADRWVLGLWNGFSPEGDAGARTLEGPLADRIAVFERTVIEAEIRKSGGRLKDVYEALQISRKGLYDKMRKLGISAGEADG